MNFHFGEFSLHHTDVYFAWVKEVVYAEVQWDRIPPWLSTGSYLEPLPPLTGFRTWHRPETTLGAAARIARHLGQRSPWRATPWHPPRRCWPPKFAWNWNCRPPPLWLSSFRIDWLGEIRKICQETIFRIFVRIQIKFKWELISNFGLLMSLWTCLTWIDNL